MEGGETGLAHLPTPDISPLVSPQLGFFKSAKRRREPGLDPMPKVLE